MYGGHTKRLPEANLAHLQPALSCDCQNRTVQKVAVRAANIQLESSSLSLSFTPTLQSGSNPLCSLLWNIWIRSFKIYGKYTHTSAQCSHTSVGLAQARPNKQLGNKNAQLSFDFWAYDVKHSSKNAFAIEFLYS